MIRVLFASKKLQRECEAGTVHGPIIGSKARLRIRQISASANLQAFKNDMQHCHFHKLQPLNKGRYAVDITANYRMILVPLNDEDQDINPDDLSDVTAVRILEVKDYH